MAVDQGSDRETDRVISDKAGFARSLRFNCRVNLLQPDIDFLRALVKTSRQRSHHVRWIDRDGVARVTTLSPEDARRVNELAQRLGVGKDTLLRQAAELPAFNNKPEGLSPS